MRHEPSPQPARENARWSMPAWAASVVLHAVLLVVLGLTLQMTTKGVSGDSDRAEVAGEIVLKHFTEDGEFYESQHDAAKSSDSNTVDSAADVISDNPPVEPSVTLPKGSIGIPESGGGNPGSEGLLSNPPQARAGGGAGTQTKFFAVESEGNSFAFVVDRSASMNHSGRLAAAKTELIAALDHLKKNNQFQIIFYNSDVHVFDPYRGRVFLADERTKKLAERFIRGITADGPTDAFDKALRKAIHYGPDVIYFLTDAEDISISDAELGILTRNNKGAVIHTIKFGEGATERVPWLLKLSRQNSGQYRYVDTRQFGRQ